MSDHVCTDWTELINGLTAEALTVFNRPPMGRVEDPINRTAAPGLRPGTAAGTAVYLEGDTAMSSIPHHEDISVLGKGVIHHPLSGRPEFKGIVDGPDGPYALIQDGDLTFRLDDPETIQRWRRTLATAGVQLHHHRGRLAQHEEGRS